MILMILWQKDVETKLALFDTMENARQFASALPGYNYTKEKIGDSWMEYETLTPSKFPSYGEIQYKGNIVPLTQFMFSTDEPVDILWEEIPNLDKENQSLVASQTRVDAYIIPNPDLKKYIQDREQAFTNVKEILNQLGFHVWRDYRGSEDGEAILYNRNSQTDGYILDCLDPSFVQRVNNWSDSELEQWIFKTIRD